MSAIILQCIITIFLGLATYYVVPFLKDKKLYNAVVIAVQAAEQIFTESGMGKEKFSYVKTWIEETFDVDEEELKNIIESAVYELNIQKQKQK